MKELLTGAGFTEIKIEIKEKAEEIISKWMPGSGAEKYVTSAYITAMKHPAWSIRDAPAGVGAAAAACCAPAPACCPPGPACCPPEPKPAPAAGGDDDIPDIDSDQEKLPLPGQPAKPAAAPAANPCGPGMDCGPRGV